MSLSVKRRFLLVSPGCWFSLIISLSRTLPTNCFFHDLNETKSLRWIFHFDLTADLEAINSLGKTLCPIGNMHMKNQELIHENPKMRVHVRDVWFVIIVIGTNEKRNRDGEKQPNILNNFRFFFSLVLGSWWCALPISRWHLTSNSLLICFFFRFEIRRRKLCN